MVAGPGSGKTRVLIERFAWLVENRGVDPGRILAVTFTEKAATEIKQRLMDRFAGRPDLREGIERAWVSTIHGFCARLLREHAIAAGLAPDFSVLDQAPSDRMARAAAEEAMDELLIERPEETRTLLESLDLSTQDDGRLPDLARSLLDVYEAMRLAGLREPPRSTSNSDALDQARRLAREILDDPIRGNTEGQKSGHAELREWARAFLALPRDAVTLRAFPELARLDDLNLGRLVQGSSRSQGGCEGAEEMRSCRWLEAHWVGLSKAPMLESAARGDRAARSAVSRKETRTGGARFLGSRRTNHPAAGIRSGDPERDRGEVRRNPAGRIAGHQSIAMDADRPDPAAAVRRGRRQPVDLRVPSCGARRVRGIPRGTARERRRSTICARTIAAARKSWMRFRGCSTGRPGIEPRGLIAARGSGARGGAAGGPR